ncbi:MAG TPA: hypothetical protein VLR26_08540 [Frankiaceae bacterium]|nr:hypothetical protein [Frankiaceae bacterium]
MSEQNGLTPDRTPVAGWRAAVIPAWSLALGLVLFVVVALALASAGGVAGIVAVAVVQGAVVYLLYTWCSAEA